MKKVLFCLVIAIISVVLVGCNNTSKTEYKINEKAVIDGIHIKLVKVEKINNELLITFSIKNKTKDTITINPEKNFKYYNNQIVVSNTYKSNKNIINSNSEVVYTLQYGYNNQKLHSIYFYSGVVENNIKFSFTSKDIK